MQWDVFGLAGKRVLVTGASRGIGLAVAEGFVAAGAQVRLLAETNAVDRAAEALESRHGRAVTTVVCDLTNAADMDGALRKVGELDVLVNNAGIARQTRLHDRESLAQFLHVIDVNVAGTFRITQALLPLMRRGSAIINTASVWGRTAPAGYSGYAASKHATIGLTRSWSRELAESGIRVNAVCPGFVETDAGQETVRGLAEAHEISPEAMRARIERGQALGGLMGPRDLVGLYLFLASELSHNITGQAINIDRGDHQA